MNLQSAKKMFWDTEEETATAGPYLLASKHLNILVRVPTQFADVKDYADALMAGDTVLVSYDSLEPLMRQRVSDYLNGVSYIIGATVEKVTGELMIYAPSTTSVSKEMKKRSWLK